MFAIIIIIIIIIVARIAVAMQPTIVVISDPFLGNGSVNTFPRQRLRMQRGGNGVLSTRCALSYNKKKKENWGNQSVELCTSG
jgi:hypothetical protein